MKPRALDLFCGAGGATRGLQLSGFHVTGVDIKPQPRYCGDEFHQADALTFPLEGYDFIWASPPCQAYTRARHIRKREHPRLIGHVRHRLIDAGVPYVIENVPGAPLRDAQILCGTAFKLRVSVRGTWYELRRHRLFECSFYWLAPQCQHQLPVIGIYGHGESKPMRDKRGFQISQVEHRREVMQMPWANRDEIAEAIPPAYSRFIGEQALGGDSTPEGGRVSTKRITSRREFVRIARVNGWAKAAIVKEPTGRCYVVMLESKAFGSFAAARKHLKESIESKDAL